MAVETCNIRDFPSLFQLSGFWRLYSVSLTCVDCLRALECFVGSAGGAVCAGRPAVWVVVPLWQKRGIALLGIALTSAPKTTHIARRKLEMRKYISVSYSLSNARQRRCLLLVCLRSELRKRKVSLLKLPIVFQGFWHFRTGDSGQHNESK